MDDFLFHSLRVHQTFTCVHQKVTRTMHHSHALTQGSYPTKKAVNKCTFCVCLLTPSDLGTPMQWRTFKCINHKKMAKSQQQCLKEGAAECIVKCCQKCSCKLPYCRAGKSRVHTILLQNLHFFVAFCILLYFMRYCS